MNKNREDVLHDVGSIFAYCISLLEANQTKIQQLDRKKLHHIDPILEKFPKQLNRLKKVCEGFDKDIRDSLMIVNR